MNNRLFRRSTPIAITCLLLVSPLFVSPLLAADGWVSLFDGKTLEGWTQKNGTAKYEVVGNTIKGTTNEGSPNSFL